MGNDEYNNDEALLIHDPEEVAVKNYKAAFYQLLAKPDSMARVYNRNIVIEPGDLHVLNEKINDKLKNYQEAGYLINVSLKYTNKKVLTFSNWQSFSEHKWYESEPLNNIVISWEFNAMLPQMQVPQRHTLMVKLSNRLRPEEMLNLVLTGKIEEVEEIDNSFFPVLAKVDFVDRVLGDELLNIVEDWVNGLNESLIPKSGAIMFLKRHKWKFATLSNFVTNIVFMVCSIILAGKYILSLNFENVAVITDDQLVQIIYSIVACVIFWTLSNKVASFISDQLFEHLKMYGESAIFNITRGDKIRQQKLLRGEKHKKLIVVINLIVTIVINIACGIIVNIVT